MNTQLLFQTWLTLVSSSSVQHLNYHMVKSCVDLPTFTYAQLSTSSKIACARACSEDGICMSFSVHSGQTVCSLNNVTIADTGCLQTTYKHYSLGVSLAVPCFHGGTYNATESACRCYHGYLGSNCERLMEDCSDAFYNAVYYRGEKDVFSVHPPTSTFPFKVYCEVVHKGKLAIMRRTPDWPEADFNRTWDEYREGFGNVAGNHWLGNQKLYYLTTNRNMTFKTVAVTTDLGTKTIFRQRFFYQFVLSPESDGFKFTFGSQSVINGDAIGDCMSMVQGYSFSTIDRDNDGSALESCAEKHLSGWWFGNCGPCNPTGKIQPSSEIYQYGSSQPPYIVAPVESSYTIRAFYIFLIYGPP